MTFYIKRGMMELSNGTATCGQHAELQHFSNNSQNSLSNWISFCFFVCFFPFSPNLELPLMSEFSWMW